MGVIRMGVDRVMVVVMIVVVIMPVVVVMMMVVGHFEAAHAGAESVTERAVGDV